MFKCDPHVHTDESSICGKIPAREITRLYKQAGFDTIFITDHVDWRRLDENPEKSFEEYVAQSTLGYKEAKDEGDKIGLTVLWATEIMLRESFNHYLVYGITVDDVKKRSDLFELSAKEFYDYMKSCGGYVVQAHPFRDEKCVPYPTCCDAFEVYNSHPRHRNHNEEALQSAIEYNKPQTAGSDSHQYPDVGLSGVLTEEKINTPTDYIQAVKEGRLEIIR